MLPCLLHHSKITLHSFGLSIFNEHLTGAKCVLGTEDTNMGEELKVLLEKRQLNKNRERGVIAALFKNIP